MSEPPVVFEDGKAVAGAHQGLLQSHVPVTGAAPGSVVPAVTNAGCTSPIGLGLPCTAWEEGSRGGKEGSSLHLLSLPGWGGHAVSPGGDTCMALPLMSCCGQNRIVRRAVSSARTSGRGNWVAVLSWCRNQPQFRDRQGRQRSSEAEGGGWMLLGWAEGAHVILYPEKLKL